mmetsp:Transcript_16355/g.58081  ORF Transcript_16355/g.58081 Transcript_16355/m.58081 type:complete len:95 (+) Transcript_16355:388-672(+)
MHVERDRAIELEEPVDGVVRRAAAVCWVGGDEASQLREVNAVAGQDTPTNVARARPTPVPTQARTTRKLDRGDETGKRPSTVESSTGFGFTAAK